VWNVSPIIEPTWWRSSWMRPATTGRLMPTTGYDETHRASARCALALVRGGFKLMVLAIFVAAIAVCAGVAFLFT
jgi:hypothetical protein